MAQQDVFELAKKLFYRYTRPLDLDARYPGCDILRRRGAAWNTVSLTYAMTEPCRYLAPTAYSSMTTVGLTLFRFRRCGPTRTGREG